MMNMLQLYKYHTNPESLDWEGLNSDSAATMLISIFTGGKSYPQEFTDMLYSRVTDTNDVYRILQGGVSILDIPNHILTKYITGMHGEQVMSAMIKLPGMHAEQVMSIMMKLHIHKGHSLYPICVAKIKDNPYVSLTYAHHIHSRFHEGEPAILKNRQFLATYAKIFFNGDISLATKEMVASANASTLADFFK